ncbi:MAG: lectin like domain-containing protein [Candidatus Marinimicrobia bacterium]|nr:lectin like domain-containing protein [Candidatus Neomarinimicrobiota bacterium]
MNEGSFVTEQSGSISFSGFYTVDLEDPVPLMKEDSFFVYLSLDQGGHAYDCSSEVPVLLNVPSVYALAAAPAQVPSRAARNESLFRENGRWKDLQTVDTTANFCIKALVKASRFTEGGAAPEKASLRGVFPNPACREIVVDYQIPEHAVVRIDLYDLQGKEGQDLCSGIPAEGVSLAESGSFRPELRNVYLHPVFREHSVGFT